MTALVPAKPVHPSRYRYVVDGVNAYGISVRRHILTVGSASVALCGEEMPPCDCPRDSTVVFCLACVLQWTAPK